MFLRVALNVLLTCAKSSLGFVQYSVQSLIPFTITHWEADFVTPFWEKIISSHLYLMREVIFEVFFETFSKTLHLFGMGRGILQPQTKIFSSLVHKKMYSIKNYPLTLNAKKAREIWPYEKNVFQKILSLHLYPMGEVEF